MVKHRTYKKSFEKCPRKEEKFLPETTRCRGSITVRLASSLTGLDSTKQENMLLLVPTK